MNDVKNCNLMNELSELGAAIEEDTAKSDLKDIIAEQTDQLAETLIGVIPGLSIINKLSKAYRSVNDFFLMQKVIEFLTELSTMSLDARKNLITKINADSIYGQKFGAYVVIALDRQDFAEKSKYLARACKFLERSEISKLVFIRLKGIIEKVELQDLKSCYYEGGDFEHCGFPRRFEHPALYLFQALGLVVIESSIASEREYSQLQARGMNGDRPRQPYLTDLGKILIHVINDIPISSFLIKQNHI